MSNRRWRLLVSVWLAVMSAALTLVVLPGFLADAPESTYRIVRILGAVGWVVFVAMACLTLWAKLVTERGR